MSIQIPIDRILDNPWQTRISYDPERITALAEDIAQHGLLQPPMGRLVVVDLEAYGENEGDLNAFAQPKLDVPEYMMSPYDIEQLFKTTPGLYIQLAFGHSRLRACRLRERDKMPVELRNLSDERMATMAWSENSQRKDLSPIEEAHAIRKRMDDFGWTQERVGAELGIDRSTVSNKLRLLKLPDEVLEHLKAGTISERQAGALVPAFEIPEEDLALAPSWSSKPPDLVRSATKGLSSDELRGRVNYLKDSIDQEKTTRALQEQARLKRESEQAVLLDEAEASPEPAGPEDEYEPEDCDLCGEPECDRTCVPAMIEDGAFDVATFGWPQPRIDPVWDELEKMTKAKISEVHDRLRCPLWNQHSDQFYSYAKKHELVAYVREMLRFHANLRAGFEMTDGQVETFGAWLKELLGNSDSYSRMPKGVTYRGWHFTGELKEMQAVGTLTGEAWQRYRLAHLRQAAGFCYHLFLEKMVEEAQRQADWELDEAHPEELQAYGDSSPWDDDRETVMPGDEHYYAPVPDPNWTPQPDDVRAQTSVAEAASQPRLSKLEESVLKKAQDYRYGYIDSFKATLSDREKGCVGRLIQLGYLHKYGEGQFSAFSAMHKVERAAREYDPDQDESGEEGLEIISDIADALNEITDSVDRDSTESVDLARLRQRFKEATSWMGLANYRIAAKSVIDATLEDLETIDKELATLAASEEDDELTVDVATYRAMLQEDLARRERENAEIMEAN